MRRPAARVSQRQAVRPSTLARSMVNRVQVLRGGVHRAQLDDEAVCDHTVAERLFRRVRPVPGEMHGLAVAGPHPRALGGGESRRQVLDRVGLDQLPQRGRAAPRSARRPQSPPSCALARSRPAEDRMLPSAGSDRRALRLQLGARSPTSRRASASSSLSVIRPACLPGADAVGIGRERGRRDRDDPAVAHRDRLGQMMTFETEAPSAGLGRRAEDGEREPLRGALAGAVAARRQHVLQRHDVLRLFETGRGKTASPADPRRRPSARAHLLQPQARLDVAGKPK